MILVRLELSAVIDTTNNTVFLNLLHQNYGFNVMHSPGSVLSYALNGSV